MKKPEELFKNLTEEEEFDELTQDDLIELIQELMDEEDLTYEEITLLSGYLYILDNMDVSSNVLSFMSDAVNNAYEEEDEEDYYIDYDAMGEEIENPINEQIKKMVRGGEIVKRKKGFRKTKKGYQKIKPSTLRKLKLAGRKRRKKKIRASVKIKMQRSRKKTQRKFKAFLKRQRKK